ncbi:DUF6873 family GME fold protein [Mogibacterium diversum]
MKIAYLSSLAHPDLCTYLENAGHVIHNFPELRTVSSLVANHPDVLLCKLGARPESHIYEGIPNELSPLYPGDCRYNAACTGKFFIHRLDITDSELLAAAKASCENELELIDVRQGYAKCSTVIIDENSIITYDRGIAKPCEAAGMNVLLVKSGFVKLRGADTGFIGGASGRVGDEIVFNGDLSAHPNFREITAFIEGRGLGCKWFESYELEDIGSIITITESDSD